MSTVAHEDHPADDRPGYIAVVEHADGTVWVDPRLAADGVDVVALMGSPPADDAPPRIEAAAVDRASPSGSATPPPKRKRSKQSPNLFNL